jgi:hypothetical protein
MYTFLFKKYIFYNIFIILYIKLLKITNLEDIKIEILEKNIELDRLEMSMIKHLNLYEKRCIVKL